MSDQSNELPEAAERRFAEGAFSSGLSVPDFAACLEMGLQPMGFVQGFCAMQWSSYAMGGPYRRGLSPYGGTEGGYVQNYQCPHGMMSAEHRAWGQNYQQPWIESAWTEGFTSAYVRMLEEATALGAHGVVGVLDTVGQLSDLGVIEFHIRGTAIKVHDAPSSSSAPWTTYLAGQRLAKIFEAGYVPISVVAAVASVRVWAYCMTEYLMERGGTSLWTADSGPVEIEQIVSARMAAREIVRTHARNQLHGDALNGVDLLILEREFAKGDLEIQCVLRGNRLRRFKDFDPLPVPQPTVRLS
jgi:uncharacterized protein YbjQ (UPF0145 family)